ncbi:MAG: hypothetical protein QG613_1646, partial [Pseudomonadota bacterium]|nr:hypothetical protein [Pseudomonadota bacterium]
MLKTSQSEQHIAGSASMLQRLKSINL